jgi:hypothetical protein
VLLALELRTRELQKQPHLTATPLDVLLAPLVYKQSSQHVSWMSWLAWLFVAIDCCYQTRRPARVQAAPTKPAF